MWYLERFSGASGLADFHSISPCGSSIGPGTWRAGVPKPEVINGRKMAAVCGVNPKAFRVEHGRLSGGEEWRKDSTNPPVKSSQVTKEGGGKRKMEDNKWL